MDTSEDTTTRNRLPQRLQAWLGTLRSMAIYWRPGRQAGLRRLYSVFVQPGDLVFDIGAHIGDRTRAFAALGARVVALEPQPQILLLLRKATARLSDVRIRREAAGPENGTAQLEVSRSHPTVSSVSRRFTREIAQRNRSFRNVSWDEQIAVPMVTLDQLIVDHGLPAFCKIDVEGLEAEVLRGLSQPIPALSFEFVAGAEEVTEDCLAHLTALGDYEYNLIVGEQRHFRFDTWQDAGAIRSWLEQHADRVGSGDIYARLRGA
ncbi:FkbM family methyltransferase [Thioalkalivibrio sp. HL-Eb18]|uniref:FkbM family methyltransferase n=1 Tax=Thioalkalivibrio sp. HL-Eb18 TaxID=1266913 RepID=UPI000380962B|nr:FkbM family methyltransferase [Thioalkalivibrio sp. HL-Eb18]